MMDSDEDTTEKADERRNRYALIITRIRYKKKSFQPSYAKK